MSAARTEVFRSAAAVPLRSSDACTHLKKQQKMGRAGIVDQRRLGARASGDGAARGGSVTVSSL